VEAVLQVLDERLATLSLFGEPVQKPDPLLDHGVTAARRLEQLDLPPVGDGDAFNPPARIPPVEIILIGLVCEPLGKDLWGRTLQKELSVQLMRAGIYRHGTVPFAPPSASNNFAKSKDQPHRS
jgi:hypothetical protein